jgi:hypothetical protein
MKPTWVSIVRSADFPKTDPAFIIQYSRFLLGVTKMLGGLLSLFDNSNTAKVTMSLTHAVSSTFKNPLPTGVEGVIAIACDTQTTPMLEWSQSGSDITVTPTYPSGSGTASVKLWIIGG